MSLGSSFLSDPIFFPKQLSDDDEDFFDEYCVTLFNISNPANHASFIVHTGEDEHFNKTMSSSLISEGLFHFMNKSPLFSGGIRDMPLVSDYNDLLTKSIKDFSFNGDPAFLSKPIRNFSDVNDVVIVSSVSLSGKLSEGNFKSSQERVNSEIKALNIKIIEALSFKYSVPFEMVSFLIRDIPRKPNIGTLASKALSEYVDISLKHISAK